MTFLEAMTAEESADLIGRGRSCRFRRGATLFNEGDPSEHVALLTSGRVKVSYTTGGGEEIVLAFRGPGDLVGDLSALDAQPRSASVTALEAVDAVVVPAPDFRQFLEAHPAAAIGLLRILAHRLRDADRMRVEFGALDAHARVARRLVELAEAFGEPAARGLRIALPLTQEELAGWIGSSRESVAKALQTLRRQGTVETRRGSITVLDMDALRRHSARTSV